MISITLSEFKTSTQHLSPSAPLAGDIWYEWSQELQQMDQVHCEDTPELAKSAEDFLGDIFHKLKSVETKYGIPIAGKVLELSLHQSCLFPWELLSAGEKFWEGASVEQVWNYYVEGLLDDTEEPLQEDDFRRTSPRGVRNSVEQLPNIKQEIPLTVYRNADILIPGDRNDDYADHKRKRVLPVQPV